jgi:2-haloacid dehalogenase
MVNPGEESRMNRRQFVQGIPAAMLATAAAAHPARAGNQAPGSADSAGAATAARAGRVIVFDVIETLLDLNHLAPGFERAFGDPASLHEFFSQMLQSAFAITVAGIYADFGSVARAALTMTAERRGVALTEQGLTQILGGIRSLPAHPEVPAGLQRLTSAGFRMAALTNSARKVLESQVTAAGIAHYFDQLLTVDTVRQFKPARAVYQSAAAALGVTTQNIRMVAAHSWDVGGAMQAGCSAAFVARPGMVLDPLFPMPDIVGRNMTEVVDRIIAIDIPADRVS